VRSVFNDPPLSSGNAFEWSFVLLALNGYPVFFGLFHSFVIFQIQHSSAMGLQRFSQRSQILDSNLDGFTKTYRELIPRLVAPSVLNSIASQRLNQDE
jgi:hypothetical protein